MAYGNAFFYISEVSGLVHNYNKHMIIRLA